MWAMGVRWRLAPGAGAGPRAGGEGGRRWAGARARGDVPNDEIVVILPSNLRRQRARGLISAQL